MKLLQLNVWGGRLAKPLMRLIERENPDILCLQEAISIKGRSNGGWFLTVEEIKNELDMHLSYSPVIRFSFMRRTAGFGNAILSKKAFLSENTVFTNLEYKDNFDIEEDEYNIRNLIDVTIKDDGSEKLHILTHHGHHVPNHKKGDEQTMRQSKQIAEYIKSLSGKIILSGDFNLEPDSQSLQQINKLLINLPVKEGIKTTRTMLTQKTEVCDYIFVNDKVKVKSFKVLEDVVSDHQALVLEFE